jgi:hypothetical protein
MVKTIVHHLGLGDHIMLNGMVRHFAENEKVNIVVRRCHEESVRFMYKDIEDKIELILVDSSHPHEVWSKVYSIGGDVLPLATYGMHEDNWKFMTEGPGKEMTNWAHGVYIQAGINPMYMYTKFKVDRDKSKELKLNYDSYIFIHDKDNKISIDTDKPIYRPGNTTFDRSNIFDYVSVIENADEFHGMNSSYAWLVELMRIGSSKTNFFHVDIAYPEYVPKTVFSDDMWTFIYNSSPQ